jgi:(2Fe-2S) ferredoxin
MSTCADLSRQHEEPLAGTAPVATGWLLVEQPGAWGRDALTASGLDAGVGAALKAATADLPVRPQVVRRPRATAERPRATADADRPGRRVVLAHAGATPWAETWWLDDDRDLLDLDPTLLLAPTPPGVGTPEPGPLLLVCTHAKRDRCCATWGRPIADTLAALHPRSTWEVSHVGGHRFAGNLVVLPDGAVYGGLDVASAVQVVAAHLAHQVDARYLRGRSGLSRPRQAAEVLVRRDLRLHHDAEVAVGEVATPDPTAPERVVVHVEAAGRPLLAHLTRGPSGTARTLSCDADEPEDPPAYVLRALEPLQDRAAG